MECSQGARDGVKWFRWICISSFTTRKWTCPALSRTLRARKRITGRIPRLLRHRRLKRAAERRCSGQRTPSSRRPGRRTLILVSLYLSRFSSSEAETRLKKRRKWPWPRNTGPSPTPGWRDSCLIFQVRFFNSCQILCFCYSCKHRNVQ